VDVLIDKPAKMRGYELHRLVEQYQQGKPALWVDEGSQVRIRPRDAMPPTYGAGKLLGFMTTACVAYGNQHRYLPLADWRGRRSWLEEQGVKHGFELVGVHVTASMKTVETHDGRAFTIDASQFSGLLRVTDSKAFSACLINGVGKVGKAFGLNLLVVH